MKGKALPKSKGGAYVGSLYTGLILGVDPSLRGTGLALLEVGPQRKLTLISSKTVRLKPALSMTECLGEIFRAVHACLPESAQGHIAMEQTIYVQNVKIAQILGAARGAVMTAASLRGWPVFEYAPLRIKQAVVGYGRASKEQVARTMMQLLKTQNALPSDEADAAGAALCHALTYRDDI